MNGPAIYTHDEVFKGLRRFLWRIWIVAIVASALAGYFFGGTATLAGPITILVVCLALTPFVGKQSLEVTSTDVHWFGGQMPFARRKIKRADIVDVTIAPLGAKVGGLLGIDTSVVLTSTDGTTTLVATNDPQGFANALAGKPI